MDGSAEARSLFVGWGSQDLSAFDLRDIFHDYKSIASIKVLTNSNGKSCHCGFVYFSNLDEAQQALQTMDGYLVNGEKIRVSVAKRRSSPFFNNTTGRFSGDRFGKNESPWTRKVCSGSASQSDFPANTSDFGSSERAPYFGKSFQQTLRGNLSGFQRESRGITNSVNGSPRFRQNSNTNSGPEALSFGTTQRPFYGQSALKEPQTSAVDCQFDQNNGRSQPYQLYNSSPYVGYYVSPVMAMPDPNTPNWPKQLVSPNGFAVQDPLRQDLLKVPSYNSRSSSGYFSDCESISHSVTPPLTPTSLPAAQNSVTTDLFSTNREAVTLGQVGADVTSVLMAAIGSHYPRLVKDIYDYIILEMYERDLKEWLNSTSPFDLEEYIHKVANIVYLNNYNRYFPVLPSEHRSEDGYIPQLSEAQEY